MTTRPHTPPTVPGLIPVADYPAAARAAGVRETDRTLINTGRLTRVSVGRRDYYRLAEIAAAAPAGGETDG